MQSKEFKNIIHSIRSHFHDAQYKLALDVIDKSIDAHRQHLPLFMYWQMVLYASLKEEDKVIQIFRSALEKGYWYNPILLQSSPALNSVFRTRAFQELAVINNKLKERDLENLYPLITLRDSQACVDQNSPCAPIIALHPSMSNPREIAPLWKSLASSGWLVTLPSAPMMMWKNAHEWDSPQKTSEDLKNHWYSLLNSFHLKEEFLTLAGHNNSGALILWISLSGSLPVHGFISINPSGSLIENYKDWLSALDKSSLPFLRGVIIFNSEECEINFEVLLEIAAQLEQKGIHCKIIQTQVTTSEHSSELSKLLLESLEFIYPD